MGLAESYELDDPDQTAAIGRTLAQLDTDASSYSKGFVEILSDVDAGGDAPGKFVNKACAEFQTDVSDTGNHLAQEVRKLGNGVVAGAKEAAETNNEGTQVANKMSVLREAYRIVTPPSAG